MTPTYIYLKNFKSIKELELDLTPYLNRTVLINGDNLDEEGCSSNRTGKSNFLKALIWIPFGISQIDDVSDEITLYGEKETVGILRFDDREIERKFKNGSQVFGYRVHGQSIGESNKDAQQAFFNDIGITNKNSSIIRNGLYLNNNTNTFIGQTATQRLQTLVDWFDLIKYDDAIERTRDFLKVKKSEQVSLEEKKFNEADLATAKEGYKKLKEKIERNKEVLIKLRKNQQTFDNLANKQRELQDSLKLYQEKKNGNAKIETARANILTVCLSFDEENYIKTCNERQALAVEISSLYQQANKATWKCPKCQTMLMFDDKLIEFNKQAIMEKLAGLDTRNSQLSEKLKVLEIDRQKFISLQREYIYNKSIADQVLYDLAPLELKIKELEGETAKDIKDYSKEIKNLELEIDTLNRQLGNIENIIESLIKQKMENEIAKKKLIEINKLIGFSLLWAGERQRSGLFQELKSLKLSKSISNLNLIANNILTSLFMIDSELSIEINKGVDIFQVTTGMKHPISSMTGGEKARAAFAVALALNKIYSTELEYLLIDEFFSALDQRGMEVTIDILNKVNGTKFIVSHVPVEAEYSINLIKEKGITRLA